MVKRDIVETVYEYDNEGKLLKKTVTETHEEEEEKITTSTWQTYPNIVNPCLNNFPIVPYCKDQHDMTLSTTSSRTVFRWSILCTLPVTDASRLSTS